jgi:hypothetical protein
LCVGYVCLALDNGIAARFGSACVCVRGICGAVGVDAECLPRYGAFGVDQSSKGVLSSLLFLASLLLRAPDRIQGLEEELSISSGQARMAGNQTRTSNRGQACDHEFS